MKCECGSQSRVTDSRSDDTGIPVTRRRRLCDGCGERFTTYELRVDPGGVVAFRRGSRGDPQPWRISTRTLELVAIVERVIDEYREEPCDTTTKPAAVADAGSSAGYTSNESTGCTSEPASSTSSCAR